MNSESLQQVEKENWTELKTFHEVMKHTFHPSEDGNLLPIRERAQEMAEKAKKMQKGDIPASYYSPEIQTSINNLVTGSTKLHELVLNFADDETVKGKLSYLHDVFHLIKGPCKH